MTSRGGAAAPADLELAEPGAAAGTWLHAVPAPAPSRWAVLGAHGGAGAATVAGLLQLGDPDGGAVRLRAGDPLPGAAQPLLVARTSAAGLRAAADLLAAWHPDVPAPLLVLVADAPAPPPPAARYRARVLAGHAASVVAVPWLWPLRAADDVAAVASTRAVRRAATRLARALQTRTSSTAPRPPRNRAWSRTGRGQT